MWSDTTPLKAPLSHSVTDSSGCFVTCPGLVWPVDLALYSQGLSAALTGPTVSPGLSKGDQFPIGAHMTRCWSGISVSSINLSTTNKLHPRELPPVPRQPSILGVAITHPPPASHLWIFPIHGPHPVGATLHLRLCLLYVCSCMCCGVLVCSPVCVCLADVTGPAGQELQDIAVSVSKSPALRLRAHVLLLCCVLGTGLGLLGLHSGHITYGASPQLCLSVFCC